MRFIYQNFLLELKLLPGAPLTWPLAMIDGWVGGWVDRWVGRWMNTCKDGWIGE